MPENTHDTGDARRPGAHSGRRVAIMDGCRTPFARSNTVFREMTALDLGMVSVRELLSRAELEGAGIDEVVYGTVVHSVRAPNIAREARAQRDYHNTRLREFCEVEGIPLADICARLRDEHLGDELHPNEAGAKLIAEEVFRVFAATLGTAGT